MIDFSDSEYFTLHDACSLLGKKPDTLKKWFANGCPHRMSGRTYEVKISEVFDWRIGYEKSILLGDDGSPTERLNLEQERARLAKEQRLEKEMTNARLRGELVSAVEVKEAWAGMILACRTKLLSLGSKVAARVSHPNQRLLAKEIEGEMKLALKELADGDS